MDIESFGPVYAPDDNFRIAPQRGLCHQEHERVDLVKAAAVVFQDVLLAQVPVGRERSMAITSLEDAVYRAVRAITA